MRRNRAPGAGNTRELRVMGVLDGEGWLCGSRRHIPGAGDVLAVRAGNVPMLDFRRGATIVRPLEAALLIEVKSTAGGPYERFGPAERRDLIETAERCGAEAWLYWWPPRKQLERIHHSQFPTYRVSEKP